MSRIFRLIKNLFTLSLWTLLGLTSSLVALILAGSLSSKLPNLLWPYLADWTEQRIVIGESSGTLYHGLTLNNIVYQDETLKIAIEHLSWRWHPTDWTFRKLSLAQFNINQAQIKLAPNNNPADDNDLPLTLLYQQLQQPFIFTKWLTRDLSIEQLSLNQIEISQDDESLLTLHQFDGQFAWQANQLVITDLHTEFNLQQQTHQAWLNSRIYFKSTDLFEGDLNLSYSGLEDVSPLLITLDWEGHLTNLTFKLSSTSPINLDSEHHWQLTSDNFKLDSSWHSLQAALLDFGELNLKNSNTQLDYQFANQEVGLTADLSGQFADFPAADLRIVAHKLAHQLAIDLDLDLTQFGQLAASLKLNGPTEASLDDFFNPKDFSLNLQTDRLNLQALHSEWDYQIDSTMNLQVDDYAKRLSTLTLNHLRLEGLPAPLELKGTMTSELNSDNDYQILANFEPIQYQDIQLLAKLDMALAKTLDGFTLHHLQLEQENNLINVSGLLDQHNYQLELDGQLNQLSQLLSHWDIDGQTELNLQTQGLLNQNWDNFNQAWLSIQLKSNEIRYQDLEFKNLTLNGNLPLHQLAWSQFKVELKEINQNHAPLVGDIQIDRQTQRQGISTRLQLEHPSAQVELETFEAQPNIEQLILDLASIRVTQPQTGIWILNHPTKLRWNPNQQLQLETSCFALVSHPNGRLCFDAQGQQLNWNWQQLPILEWLADVIPDTIKLETLIKGQGSLNWQDTPLLSQRIDIPKLDLLVTEQGIEWPATLYDWHIDLSLNPIEGKIQSQARVNETGYLATEIHLFNPGEWKLAELDGYIRVQLNEWALSEQLTRQFDLKRTQLDWQTLVMGSIQDIQHNSRALIDIDFDLPLLNLKQQNLSLQADIANEALSAFGQWNQPDQRQARLNLNLAPLSPDAEIELTLKTDSIELVKTPFAQLFMAADLQLHYAEALARVRGNAEVHNSYLNLDKMPLHQQTSISPDEIIVTSEGEQRQEKGLGLPLDYDITVAFGSNVKLNVRDAQAFLGGDINIKQAPHEENMTAQGDIKIERGYIELDRRNRILFEPSSFSFTGNINNPRLNVNLFRQVDRTTARLNITGTSTQPQFVFYANPPQSQARIINLLIFGRAGDLENEPNYQSQILTAFYKLGIQNNAPVLNRLTRTLGVEDIYFDVQDQQVSSLLLGRALTDEIYIRYAHDLSGQQNSAVQIFYQLTPRWLLRSDNRNDRSSVDLLFQQERD